MTDKLIELDPSEFRYYFEDAPSELDDAYPGDSTHCAVGRHCAGLRAIGDREYPAIIATYLHEDPYTGYEREAWATCFYWESTGPVLDGKPTAICEDCASYFGWDSYDYRDRWPGEPGSMDVDPTGETMFEGEVGGVVWTVAVNDRDTFFAYLAAYAPDHGCTWDEELGVYPTVLDALAAVGEWARHREADLDRTEALLDEMETDHA